MSEIDLQLLKKIMPKFEKFPETDQGKGELENAKTKIYVLEITSSKKG